MNTINKWLIKLLKLFHLWREPAPVKRTIEVQPMPNRYATPRGTKEARKRYADGRQKNRHWRQTRGLK